MGCHALLQGIFLTQVFNLGLLHCRQILFHLSHQGSPVSSYDWSTIHFLMIYLTKIKDKDLFWWYREFDIMKHSVQFSCSVVSNSLQPHELQHARPLCPSPTPGVYPKSCPSIWWCHPTISSSIIPFSSCLLSFPASGSFPMSQLFTSGGKSIRVSASASVLPMNIQDLFPLGWTGWISLLSKGLSRVFSNPTVQKHQFFGVQLSL